MSSCPIYSHRKASATPLLLHTGLTVIKPQVSKNHSFSDYDTERLIETSWSITSALCLPGQGFPPRRNAQRRAGGVEEAAAAHVAVRSLHSSLAGHICSQRSCMTLTRSFSRAWKPGWS